MKKLILSVVAVLVVFGIGNLTTSERHELGIPAGMETSSENGAAQNLRGPRSSSLPLSNEETDLSLYNFDEVVNSLSNHSRDELIDLFNPEPIANDTFIEAMTSGHPLDRAEEYYGWRWEDFVESLDLSEQERNRLKELLIAHEAHNMELRRLAMTGQISTEDHMTHRRSLDQLAASLETIISEDQLALFWDDNERHSNQLNQRIAERDALYLENGVVGILDAADRSDPATVLAYINSGADVNATTVDGKSPLHYAITHGNVEIARMLLQAGADPNMPTANELQSTPLKNAASNGNIEIIRALIAAGADPDFAPNSPGLSPLPSAAFTGQTTSVAVLLELGADATGEAGSRALTHAVRHGNHEIEQMLIDAGAQDEILTTAAREFREVGRRLGVVNN